MVWTIPVDPVYVPYTWNSYVTLPRFFHETHQATQPQTQRVRNCSWSLAVSSYIVLVWSTDKPKPSLEFKYPFRDCRQRKYLIIHRKSDFLTKQKRISPDHPMFLKLRIGCFSTNWMSSIGTSLTMRAGGWRSNLCPTWQRTVPSVAAATSSSHSMVATRGGAATWSRDDTLW